MNSRSHEVPTMDSLLDRLATDATANPAVLHILSRNCDVLRELSELDTTRAFGCSLEDHVARTGDDLELVLEAVRQRIVAVVTTGWPAAVYVA
jgi:hypothetical protein